MAAELIEAGVDVHDTYRRLYERVPLEKLRLISRALERIERYEDGRLAMTYIATADYAAAGADEVAHRGRHRLPPRARGHRWRPSCATRRWRRAGPQGEPALGGGASTSRRSPASYGGGGHPRAAGFSTDLRTTSWSACFVPSSRPSAEDAAPGRPARRQARRADVARRRRPRPPRARAEDRARRHARSVRHRPADRARGARATREQAPFMALPKTYRAWPPRSRLDEATRRVRSPRPGWRRRTLLSCPTGEIRQRPPATRPIKIGASEPTGERAAGGPRDAGAFRDGVPLRPALARGEPRGAGDRCSTGTYVRSLIAALGDAYCERLRRLSIGPFASTRRPEGAADRRRGGLWTGRAFGDDRVRST